MTTYHYKPLHIDNKEYVSSQAKVNQDLIGSNVDSEEELKKINYQFYIQLLNIIMDD